MKKFPRYSFLGRKFLSPLRDNGLVTAQPAPARRASLVRPASLSATKNVWPNRARSASRTCLGRVPSRKKEIFSLKATSPCWTGIRAPEAPSEADSRIFSSH